MRTQKLDRATTFWIVTIECVSKLSLTGSLFVLMFLFIIDFSCAQPKVKIFDKESGLSSNDVVSIVQDQAGYLWVGTKNGLNRFDGNTFKVFKYSSQNENSLFSNFIRCLAVDRFNRIWIGHESNITCYDPTSDNFTRYSLTSTGPITFISFDHSDRVWVGIWGHGAVVINSESGAIEKKIDLVPFINKKYEPLEINRYNTIEGMYADSSDNVWMATYDGLYVYDRELDAVKPIRVVDDTPGKHRNDYFRGILSDKNNGFWLAAYHGGLCHYSPKQDLFSVNQITIDQHQKDLQVSFTNTVSDISWKNEKELWFISWDKEKPIGSFDIETKTFSFLRLPAIVGNGVKTSDILFSELFVDNRGLVWVGSGMGLVMINPDKPLNFDLVIKSGTEMIFTAIVEDTVFQKRFMGTNYSSDLVVSNVGDDDDNSRTFRGRIDPAYGDHDYIQGLLNTNGDSLWVISRDNIRLFDKLNEKWINVPRLQKIGAQPGSVSPSFYRMIKSSTGDYWIATLRNGAYRLFGTDLSIENFKSSETEGSICSNFIVDLLEDKFGRIWFASPNSGISILDPSTNLFKGLNNSGKEGSYFLATNSIYSMDADPEGNIWLATREIGIVKINLVSDDSLNVITVNHELLTSPASEIQIDGRGRIWFRSSSVNVLNPETMNIKSLGSKIHADHALIKSNNHVLVNGANKYGKSGYGIIDEKDLLPDTTSNPLVINSIKVFGQEIYPVGVNHDRVYLPYNQNSIVIDFAAIDFIDAKKINYSYKLEGSGTDDWTIPSSNRSTEFADLNGGDYIFKLRASNQEGIWSKEESLLYIHIETPFWETTWFYALVVLVCIGITVVLYFYQLNRNKRISQLQLKALHTQMRPHFIFNCLSAINSQIIKSETVKASEFLSKFSRLMRGILENSTESWITLEQEIETLRLYLIMEGLRFEEKLSYKIEVEEGVDPAKTLIPSMILQPYVENAIGHGLLHKKQGIGIINIKFIKGDGNLKCVIEDNGIGREHSAQLKQRSKTSHKSLGMQITSERLQLLQGSAGADIQDLKNELGEPMGTRIIIMLMAKKVEDKDLVNLN